MTDTLIRVENVSKKFCRSLRKSLWYGMQDLGNELIGGQRGGYGELRSGEFWAVKEVGFELRRGECLGLVGHNGAGKTTLLRMLNGLIKPDTGRIEMYGQVGALIALGAGFNPILTGRENIYINGAVLGLGSQEVAQKINAIIEFADIGEFIDAPVQTYSSGMSVRLGFAVAAILLEPDILVLDEVLAVGDIGFTIKCLNLVREIARNSAVVLVSHNMQYISSFCTRVMVLERGKILLDSLNPAEGIDRYFCMVEHSIQISGTGEAKVKSIDLLVDGSTLIDIEPTIMQGTPVQARLSIDLYRARSNATICLYIMDEAMSPIICMPVCNADGELSHFQTGEVRIGLLLGPLELATGKYSFVVSIHDAMTKESLARVQGLKTFRVFAERTYWGKIVRPVVLELC